MGLRVNGADILTQEHATAAADPGPPLPPARAVDQIGAVHFRNGGSFLIAEGDAVGTT